MKLLLLIICCSALAGAQITDLGVPHKRFLHDTPWGQLHYAASPAFDPSKKTLLLFHGNPDSMIAYRQLLNSSSAKGRYNFLAFDYFGCGSSDDCVPPACVEPPESPTSIEAPHSFVTIPEFIGSVKEIVAARAVPDSGLVCFGFLKGSQLAIECARQLQNVHALFALAPVWFNAAAVPVVMNYTLHTRKVQLMPDGQQYIDAWHQPSVAPCDQVNASYCAVWEPHTMQLNHLKTLNRARAFQTQWQFILAGLAANDDLVEPNRIAELSTKVVYLGWPKVAMEMWKTDGFDPAVLVPAVNGAWQKHAVGKVKVDYVSGASEGMMYQNASYFAEQLSMLV